MNPVQRLAAVRLVQTKTLLFCLQHREKRQDRVLQNLSDQTAFWTLTGRIPVVRFALQLPEPVRTQSLTRLARLQEAPTPSLPERWKATLLAPTPLGEELVVHTSLSRPKTKRETKSATLRPGLPNPTPRTETPLPSLPQLTWAESQFSRARYAKVEVGESPVRWQRRGRQTLTHYLQRRRLRAKQPGPRLRVPTPARRKVEVVSSSTGTTLQTKARWQEKRLSLAQQVRRQRELLWNPLRPFPKTELQPGWRAKEVALPTLSGPESAPAFGKTDFSNQPRIALPYQSLQILPEPGRRNSSVRSERLVGPLQGPRFLATGLHSSRVQLDLKKRGRRFDRQDAPRLFQDGRHDTERARYAVRSERQQETAEERHGEAQWTARRARRFRRATLRADRPYRASRVGSWNLGRRVRPRLAARRRPLRRRDALSHAVQREIAKLGGVPRTLRHGRTKSFVLPTHQTPTQLLTEKRTPSWSRYLSGHDLSLAQARRRWWRQWHRLDTSLYGELRRAGSRFRDRAGRKNLGWWRSLQATSLDTPLRRSGRGRPDPSTAFARRSKVPSQAPRRAPSSWRDQRAVSLGWATRLKDPATLERVLSRDLAGRPDPRLPFWSLTPSRSWSTRALAPFTLAFLYAAWRIRSKAYDSVQGDFLRARETILRRGGVRERDPEWRSWLLEALGISRAGAGIRRYPPGDRSLARHLAGLRRDLPILRERLSYLRSSRRGLLPAGRGPRPTLLVGAPGTGKTSLVRILADEASVPVVYQCLAAFTDAGARFTAFGFGRTVAPQAVQRGFEEARRASPAILFLDEIDALGANRGGVLQAEGESQEKPLLRSGDQVLGLGQLLVEVDSSAKNKGLVLFAATNRPEELDPALVRPGRFDRTVSVPLPNRGKRRSILKLYTGRLGASPALDWNYLVARTLGYSAAHLASLTNSAAISAILAGRQQHESQSFEQALQRLHGASTRTPAKGWGDLPSRVREAYYQAATGLVSWLLKGEEGLDWLRLGETTGGARAGSYQRRQDRWTQLQLQRAGRAGELILQRERYQTEARDSTRSLPDLRRATRLARRRIADRRFGTQLWTSLPTLPSPQGEEFRPDPKLGDYVAQRAPEGKGTPTPVSILSQTYVQAKEALEWPAEWYAFEIAEVAGFRSVGWVPPEAHYRTTHTAPTVGALGPQTLIAEALQRNLWLLLQHRTELDLLAAHLLQQESVSKAQVKTLLPGLWG